MPRQPRSERRCIAPGVERTAAWTLMSFVFAGGIGLLWISRFDWNWIAAQWWALGMTALLGTIILTAYLRWFWEFQCDTQGIHQHGKSIRWNEPVYITRLVFAGAILQGDANPGLLKRLGFLVPGRALYLPPLCLFSPRSGAQDAIHAHAPIGHPLITRLFGARRDAQHLPRGTTA
jgi:hypothetical protein